MTSHIGYSSSASKTREMVERIYNADEDFVTIELTQEEPESTPNRLADVLFGILLGVIAVCVFFLIAAAKP